MESIFLSDTEYEELASHTEQLITQLDELPYPKVKEDMQQLLQNFDVLHREALTRLFKEIIINFPALQTKMESDKAVNLLFSLYDLFRSDIHIHGFFKEDVQSGNGTKFPLWLPVGNTNELKENTAYKYAGEGENVLICKSEGIVHAVRNSCGQSVLPLDGCAIEKGYLICPWHGCVYRLSDGVMETNPLLGLKKYQVTLDEDGEIKIGFNM